MPETLPPVLHLIDSLALGGAERMAVNLSNLLASQGHKVHLCASRSGGSLQSFITSDVSFLILGRKGTLDFGAIFRLATYIRTHGIKIVHAHSSSFFLASVIKPLTGIELIWHDHFGSREDRSSRAYNVLKLCSVGFSWSFSVNEQLMNWARENLLISNGKISYLPNFPVLTNKSNSAPDLPGINGYRVVCVARLHPDKDHHTLIRAMQQVHAEVPEGSLLLVGFDPDNAYAQSVKSLITELGLSGCIHLLGPRTDIADILSECAIGVLSSKSEGLPVALLEYGISGLPVVCTSVGECAAVLGHGAFGRVVSPGDPDALSTALISLLRDVANCCDIGNAFRAHVIDKYSGSAICKQVSEIYRKVSND